MQQRNIKSIGVVAFLLAIGFMIWLSDKVEKRVEYTPDPVSSISSSPVPITPCAPNCGKE